MRPSREDYARVRDELDGHRPLDQEAWDRAYVLAGGDEARARERYGRRRVRQLVVDHVVDNTAARWAIRAVTIWAVAWTTLTVVRDYAFAVEMGGPLHVSWVWVAIHLVLLSGAYGLWRLAGRAV